jgi:hypothetical protein
MKVLVKKPDEHPTIEEIPNELESLQRTVGGYIETLRVIGMAGTNRTLTLICDEEAKLKTPRPKENLKKNLMIPRNPSRRKKKRMRLRRSQIS